MSSGRGSARTRVRAFARAVALVASAGCLALWGLFVARASTNRVGATPATGVVVGVMVALALGAALAAARGAAGWLAAAALGSLVPVGCYLYLTPSVFRWIGVLDVVLLAAAMLMVLANRGKKDVT